MTGSQFPTLSVSFLGCTKDPVEILYSARKISQSCDDAMEIWQQIQGKSITREEMINYISDRREYDRFPVFKQAQFVFLVNNISRISALALKRHQVEKEKAETPRQGKRLKNREQISLTPPSIQDNPELLKKWTKLQDEMVTLYNSCLELGINKHDAEYVMPQGLLCREQLSMSFQGMQQFLDVKLCEKTAWEIKEMSWQMYHLMKETFPSLADRLGIKCWENRSLFCDEPLEFFKTCVWQQKRPHKSHLNTLWNLDSFQASEKSPA